MITSFTAYVRQPPLNSGPKGIIVSTATTPRRQRKVVRNYPESSRPAVTSGADALRNAPAPFDLKAFREVLLERVRAEPALWSPDGRTWCCHACSRTGAEAGAQPLPRPRHCEPPQTGLRTHRHQCAGC